MRVEALRDTRGRIALFGLALVHSAAIHQPRVDIEPSPSCVGQPMQTKNGAVTCAGVETDQNETREVPCFRLAKRAPKKSRPLLPGDPAHPGGGVFWEGGG